jgi:glucosylceramidase
MGRHRHTWLLLAVGAAAAAHDDGIVRSTLLLAAPPAAPPSSPVVQIWETGLDSGRRLARLPDERAVAGPAPAVSPGHPVLVLDASQQERRQKIVGFGGAFTEAAAVALADATPLQQQQVLEGYFGESGLGYSLCRVHMGSCDYCEASYSEDDTPGDWSLQHFNVSHDESTLLPLIRRARATRASWGGPPFSLLASPWSPPAWLKTNGKMSGKPAKKHKLAGASLLPDSGGHSAASTWALYFSRFISEYAARGADIDYVTAQNEPTNFPCSWESCHFTPASQASFIAEHLGPTLNRSHPNVKILALDDNKELLERWTDTVYGSAAAPYVAGAGLHWYTVTKLAK